jgi:hypothetical protein
MATKKTPLEKAKHSMSGAGTRSRVAAAEQKAMGANPRAKAKPKPTRKVQPAYKPPSKGVASRQAQIDAAQAADRKAIAAMQRKKAKKTS